jgi:DNA polymerase III subunit gamma/tau
VFFMCVYQIKYRPKKIKELDSLSARRRLGVLLAGENKPRAWLFAGPRGVGKTSAARILAKQLNCLSPEGIEPCGKCEICKQIESGAGMDVIEMDAASNRGIDDVRVLKENVHLSPIAFKFKVFIIDEVHMMTKEAFNALLKILEEPPAHVVFVLCTTNPEKIPATVLSRLTRVDFPKGKKEEVLSSLQKVVKGEKLKVEKGVLEKLSEMVDGSFRDAHKTLLVLMAEGKGVLDKKTWEEFLSKGGLGEEKDFLDLVVEGKLKESFLALEEMSKRGVDLFEFRQNLLKTLQEELLFLIAGIGEGKGLKIEKGEIDRLINCFLEAGDWEKKSVLPQLGLQMALLKYFDEPELVKVWVERKEESHQKVKQASQQVKKKEEVVEIGKGMDIKKIRDLWPKVLLAVRPHNHSVEAFLRASRPILVEGKRLVLEVFYRFHKDRLEDERNREVVEKGLLTVLGREYKVFCKLGRVPVVEKAKIKEILGEKKKGEPRENKEDLYEVAKELFG